MKGNYGKDFVTGCLAIVLIGIVIFVLMPVLIFLLKLSLVIVLPLIAFLLFVIFAVFFGRIINAALLGKKGYNKSDSDDSGESGCK